MLLYCYRRCDKANVKALLLMPDAQWQTTGLYTTDRLKTRTDNNATKLQIFTALKQN
jgi:hypothetical protein